VQLVEDGPHRFLTEDDAVDGVVEPGADGGPVGDAGAEPAVLQGLLDGGEGRPLHLGHLVVDVGTDGGPGIVPDEHLLGPPWT